MISAVIFPIFLLATGRNPGWRSLKEGVGLRSAKTRLKNTAQLNATEKQLLLMQYINVVYNSLLEPFITWPGGVRGRGVRVRVNYPQTPLIKQVLYLYFMMDTAENINVWHSLAWM